MSDSLADLEQQRAAVLRQICELEDFRPGSITGTGGRCGNPGCHCHRHGDPGHRPHPRLTYKVNGKTVTESFATPAEQRKAEREIETFRRYRQLERSSAARAARDALCRASAHLRQFRQNKRRFGLVGKDAGSVRSGLR